VLFGVVPPVNQVFQVVFELEFIHLGNFFRAMPCPVPDLTLLFFNPA
jgi:hypothetical protein